MTLSKDVFKSVLQIDCVQIFICHLIALYLRFVFFTSKVKICGYTEEYLNYFLNGKATFVVTWHGRMFLGPMIVRTLLKKTNYRGRLCVLSSKHRDGKIASRVMKIFNFKEIVGSTFNEKKLFMSEESGAVKSIMVIMREIKVGSSIHLAPDGPRGPVRKMNSKVIDIAKKFGTPVFPVAISYSIKKQLSSWDEFQIPLPFGKVYVEYLEPLKPEKNSDSDESNSLLEARMNKIFANDFLP